jgi:hypothetical protein
MHALYFTALFTALNGNFLFDLCYFDLRNVFQENNPAVKPDLPV